MAKLDQLELPNGVTYDLDDRFARKLTDNDFDIINVTELNAGDLIVTGVGRFTNGLYGNLTGNADTASSATKATQDESGNNIKNTYANSFSISDHTITLKNKNGTSLGTVTVPDNNTTYTIGTGTANGKIKVTPSSGNAYEVSVYGLKSAAYKDVTDTYSATGTDPVSGKAVAAAIDALPEPMVFKGSLGTGGTITTLPTNGTAKVGDTYKVITAGTYASKAAKVGDTFICLTKTSSANTWELIPSGDEPSGTVTSVAVSNGGGLSVSGSPITTSGTITISHADTSSQASVNNSGRTYIQDITLDTYGHVTGITSATETVTNTDRYVNSAAFTDATSADANNPLKMTLTRAGSDTASVTAYLPKISSSSAGIVPKGTAVSSQSQSTKFLREDGTWAAPSYTTNTNTTYTLSADTTNNKITLTPSSGSAQSITVPYATSAGSANSAAWDDITGKPTTFPPEAHNHGTLHSDFTATIANTTEDSGWSMINSSYNGFLLKSIRYQQSSPAWGISNFGSGICFGGADTKGILSVGYQTPHLKIAGGNGTKPVWWFSITGTSGTSYNLNNISNGNARDNTKLPLTGGTLTGNLEVTDTLVIKQTSGTTGGISLYKDASSLERYGIMLRKTDNMGKHGVVQSDWATYFTMAGADTRGWIFKHTNGNIASINAQGHAVFNGSVTIGGNVENTSGCRQVYNSTTQSLDFEFI